MTIIKDFESLDTVVKGFMPARVILTGVYLDIFTKIADGARSAADLARENGWDPRGTAILLDALAALGLLKKKIGSYSNADTAQRHLRRDKEDFKGWGILHRNTMWLGWSNLNEIIQRKPSERPSNLYNKEFNRYFINAMHQFHYDEAKEIAGSIGIRDVKRMVDIAGGAASYSIAFAELNPALESTVADLPTSLSVAKEKVAEHGLEKRVILKECDLSDPRSDLGSGYDLAFLSHIFHSFSEKENIQILKRVLKILLPKGRAVVNEIYINDDKTEPLEGALFSVNMLAQTEGGDTYPQSVIMRWLKETGFEPVRISDSITAGIRGG